MTSTPEQDPETSKNTANDSEGYKTGYGKPPKDKQWKKGECPKRRVRPRRDEYRDLFDSISNEKITIYENGKEICLRKRLLLAKRVVDLGIAGHPECEKMLIKVEQPDLAPPAGSLYIEEVDSEDEIPARRRELLRRRNHRASTGDTSRAGFGRGRPRNDAPFPELIKRELNKRVEGQENGKTFTITKREFWMRRLWNDAIKGNPKALRTYTKLAKPTDAPEDSFFWIIGGL